MAWWWDGQRYVYQATDSDLSRLPFPVIPGSGGGSLPVQPTYPNGANAIPRLGPFSSQPEMGPPAAFPRPPEPRLEHFRGGTSGRSNISEPQDRQGPSSGHGSSYEFVPSHATHPQVHNSPPPAFPRPPEPRTEHFRGGTSGRSNIPEPQYPPGPSSGRGLSHEFVPSHAPERTHPQVHNPPPAFPRPPGPRPEHFRGGASGHPNTSQPQYPPGPSSGHGSSQAFVPPHAPEGTHTQVPVHNPPPWPSTPQRQPPPLYNEGRGFQDPQHAPLSHPYIPRLPRKKSLLVGINYTTHPDIRFRLNWGVNDAYGMANFLQERCGFDRNNMRILTDDQRPENLPTKANILAAMRWLVEGARPGDSLFFYFSGHATQVEDMDEDEPDGFDECLCTMDFRSNRLLLSSPDTPGIIVDDQIHDIMVKPLQKGCRLTAALDCCHSGTLLDLPFIYDSHGRLKRWNARIAQRKSSEADVISLSACKDGEKAFEAREGGALRKAFIEYMMNKGNRGTFLDVIQSLRAYMPAHHFNQRPQLSSSHRIDINQPFVI